MLTAASSKISIEFATGTFLLLREEEMKYVEALEYYSAVQCLCFNSNGL